jgi:hypothetical protein
VPSSLGGLKAGEAFTDVSMVAREAKKPIHEGWIRHSYAGLSLGVTDKDTEWLRPCSYTQTEGHITVRITVRQGGTVEGKIALYHASLVSRKIRFRVFRKLSRIWLFSGARKPENRTREG